MTTCFACGFRFEGLSSHCPRCEAVLPRAASSTRNASPRGPRPLPIGNPPLATRQKVVLALVPAAVGVALAAAFFIASFALFFCMDLDFFGDDGVDDCADKRASEQEFLRFVAFPGIVLGTAGAFVVLWRRFRTTNRRRPGAPRPATLPP